MSESVSIVEPLLQPLGSNTFALTRHVVETEACGDMELFVEGDLNRLQGTSNVFLTVHDVGSSYLSWVKFTKHNDLREIKKRSVFLHLSVCGQTPSAEDIDPEVSFPSMQELSEGLVEVLDELNIETVVGLGDGAGANILLRFAMDNPGKVWGILLLNCSAAAGPESVDRSTIMAAPRLLVGINRLHKETISKSTSNNGRHEINSKNQKMFEESYSKRSDLLNQLPEKLRFETLLITGTKSKFLKDTEEIHAEVKPGHCSIIKIDDVEDVMKEAADKLVDAIILFCQGLGLMPSARRSSRSWSVSSQPENRIGPRPVSMERLNDPSNSILTRIKGISLTVPAPVAARPSVLARFGVE